MSVKGYYRLRIVGVDFVETDVGIASGSNEGFIGRDLQLVDLAVGIL